MGALLVMGAGLAENISRSRDRAGTLAISKDHQAEIVRVHGLGPDNGGGAGSGDGSATWCHAVADLHLYYDALLKLQAGFKVGAFVQLIDPGAGPITSGYVLTWAPEAGTVWAAWEVGDGVVVPRVIDILPANTEDPLTALTGSWPLVDLRGEVVVIGLGSIGSSLAQSLARYGVTRLTLVDPSRLRWHNLVRHQSTVSDLARYKVDAVAEAISSRWPTAEVGTHRLNVIYSADRIRPLFRRCSLVVCAADGVGPRRVVSHLARRAQQTAILACVLADGGLGEVVRLRPWEGFGCLLCLRASLSHAGAMDPEPTLDSDYGTGTMHRPMTAVGSDLALVGEFAAKVAVATLLEDAGHHDQRLPGDWALLGLRGDLHLRAPFDVPIGEIRWPPMAGSLPGCPTCGII